MYQRGLVYIGLGYWILDTDLVKGLQQALPVCRSLVNNEGIEPTFLCKAPRPSARVLTLRHAPTSRHDIVWAREPLVQQTGAAGKGTAQCNFAEVSFKSCRSGVCDCSSACPC